MAAIAPSSSSLSNPSPLPSSANSQNNTSRFTRPFSPIPQKPTLYRPLHISNSLSPKPKPKATSTSITTTPITTTSEPQTFISRYAPDEPRKGADVLVEALERQGVTDVFAYPGGASMEIHQALTRSSTIRNVLPRHEQGGVFAAEGYARASGLPGVCIATSGPGATNLVSGLADALLDSVPLVAITGQVPRRMIGTDAFQETPIVEVTRSITKHNYLVLDVEEIPRIVREAFFLATSGRPGPVLIDIPKDIQQQLLVPNWNQPMSLPGYMSRLPKSPSESHLDQIVRLVSESKKPVLYVGGGCLNSSDQLRRFVDLTGIPVASTLMGLGAYPCSDELSLQMLGMHGTVCANYAVDKSDLLLAFGVRFDDRVTGKLEAFASRAKIVHIDIDSAEIGKNKQPHVSVCADVKLALAGINRILEGKGSKLKLDFSAWREELKEQKVKFPLSYKTFGEAIPPQYAIQVLDELTDGNAIISTGVGQHQMWAAQFYKYRRPRQWLTSVSRKDQIFKCSLSSPSSMNSTTWEEKAFAADAAGHGPLGGCIWPPRSYSCSFCMREFRSAQALGGHMNVHRRDRARLKQCLNPNNTAHHHHSHEAHHHHQLSKPSDHDHDDHHQPITSSISCPFASPSRAPSALVSIQKENSSGAERAFLSHHSATSAPSKSDHQLEKNIMTREEEDSRCLLGSYDHGDFNVETDLSVGLNISVVNRNRSQGGSCREEASISCKRPKTATAAISSFPFFLQSEAEVTGLMASSSMEDLDLELRLGDPPKVK